MSEDDEILRTNELALHHYNLILHVARVGWFAGQFGKRTHHANMSVFTNIDDELFAELTIDFYLRGED